MSENEARWLSELPTVHTGTRSPTWWGVVFLIVTEAALFAYFIASYFNLRFHVPVWPPDGIPRPELLVPSINTLILLGSSVPMYWANSSISHGHQGRLRLGLALSFGMGLVFLIIQAMGASRWPFTPGTNAYTSAFVTITGFHAAHVVVGLVMNAVAQVLAWLGYFTVQRRIAVESTAMYWHFVVAVGIFVFGTLQVSPYVL